MKKLPLIILIFGFNVLAENKYEVINFQKMQTFEVGWTPTQIKMNLPLNTVKWYYSFRAYKSKEQSENEGKTLGMVFQLISPNLLSNLVGGEEQINFEMPKGSQVADISLQKLDTTTNRYFEWGDGTRKNLKEGIVEITNQELMDGTIYLILKNPKLLHKITIELEAVAIVMKGNWRKIYKDKLFDGLYLALKDNIDLNKQFTEIQLKTIIGCGINVLSTQYEIEDFSKISKFDQEMAIIQTFESCEKNIKKNIDPK